eukprot:g43255.t1
MEGDPAPGVEQVFEPLPSSGPDILANVLLESGIIQDLVVTAKDPPTVDSGGGVMAGVYPASDPRPPATLDMGEGSGARDDNLEEDWASVEKAFDRVYHKHLLRNLQAFRFGTHFVTQIRLLYSSRVPSEDLADVRRMHECQEVYTVASSTRINWSKCSGFL